MTTSGSFFVKSTYEKLREGLWNSKESIWQLPWKFQGLQRVRFFIWLTLKEQLLTNAEKTRRGIGMNIACGICGHDYENVLHVLRDCIAAKDIWNQLIPTDGSVRSEDAFATAGGLLCDQNGEWIIGFNRY
ncbi:hypothetical protein Gotri_018671, partial [Gossypium trilobum]|nr:hypothetical protein [Gossypium trilobum]